MNQQRPASEVLQRQGDADTRQKNGTGEGADEEQLGVTEEEVDELEDDAEGG